MTHVFNLTREDEDQLKELLNIGVSHASTTLSKMVRKTVTISVPKLGVQNAQSLRGIVKDPDAITVAVLLRLSGVLEGYVLLLFPFSAAVSPVSIFPEPFFKEVTALSIRCALSFKDAATFKKRTYIQIFLI